MAVAWLFIAEMVFLSSSFVAAEALKFCNFSDRTLRASVLAFKASMNGFGVGSGTGTRIELFN